MGQCIAISSGDPNGIGPEIILKTLKSKNTGDHTFIILSASPIIDFYNRKLNLDFNYRPINSFQEAEPGAVNLLHCYELPQQHISPGELNKQAGRCAMQAVEKGIALCNNRQADALVTAPISKEAVNLAGYNIPGHTEFLAEHTDTKKFMMMLVNEGLRVGLNSVHIPLGDVKETATQDSIIKHATIMHQSLRKDFMISDPKIAILGLNPHAGDGGVIGSEEMDIIVPAIRKLVGENIKVTGPHAADGFFGNKKYESYDGILAMYHDQGLIPFKALSFGQGVNFTAGLPIVRTSPDHGTAFDIAGQGKADPSSFQQALNLAVQLSTNRKQKAV